MYVWRNERRGSGRFCRFAYTSQHNITTPMPLRPKGSGLGVPKVINPSLMDTDMEILPIPAFWRVRNLEVGVT